MPDYSIIEALCDELDVALAELIEGEEDEKSIHIYDDQQTLKMLEETQILKKKKLMLIGIVLFLMGIVYLICSWLIGGTDVQEMLSGFTFGLSFPHMLLGVVLVVRSRSAKKQKGYYR